MTRRAGGVFYGWVTVGVAFVTQFVTNGFVFYSFAVMLTSLADEFSSGSRAPILGVQLAMGVSGIAMAPFIGRMVGRGWIRQLMTAGTVATGLGLLAVAHAPGLWQIAALFGTLLAFGGNTMAGLTATTIVVNWFDRRRATALGVSQLGASLGGMVMAPVVAALVAARGWRGAYEVLGFAVLCLVPAVWALAVGRPEDRDLLPDGEAHDPERPPAAPGAAGEPTPFRTADGLREPNLWLISVATGLAFMATTALINHIVAFGQDAGFGTAEAALLASVLSAGAALGKLVFGWLCDRMGARPAFIVSLACQALGFVTLVQVSGYRVTLAVVLATGVALGGTLPLSSALLAQAFGRAHFGPMMGLMWPIAIPLQLVGPIFAAFIRDASGSYDAALWVFVGVIALGAVLVRAIRLPAAEPVPA